jgi:deoxycytidylate deaminase
MAKKYNITAIIYDKKNHILSIGKNNYSKSHPYMARLSRAVSEPYKIWLHAEVDAIIKCRHLDKAHRIQIFRYDNQGNLKLAKPCDICLSAIHATDIKIIEYSVEHDFTREFLI